MNFALRPMDLHYSGGVSVSHIMDLFAAEPVLETIRQKAGDRIKGLRVAPYYGCQIVRPTPGAELPGHRRPRYIRKTC